MIVRCLVSISFLRQRSSNPCDSRSARDDSFVPVEDNGSKPMKRIHRFRWTVIGLYRLVGSWIFEKCRVTSSLESRCTASSVDKRSLDRCRAVRVRTKSSVCLDALCNRALHYAICRWRRTGLPDRDLSPTPPPRRGNTKVLDIRFRYSSLTMVDGPSFNFDRALLELELWFQALRHSKLYRLYRFHVTVILRDVLSKNIRRSLKDVLALYNKITISVI